MRGSDNRTRFTLSVQAWSCVMTTVVLFSFCDGFPSTWSDFLIQVTHAQSQYLDTTVDKQGKIDHSDLTVQDYQGSEKHFYAATVCIPKIICTKLVISNLTSLVQCDLYEA